MREEMRHRCYKRWKLSENVYRDDLKQDVGHDHDITVIFMGDQVRFGEQVNKYKNGDRGWPGQITCAFQECKMSRNNNPRAQ